MGSHLQLPAGAAAGIAQRRPFAFGHTLEGHPLLSLAALAELADRLPADAALVERFGDASFVRPHEARGAARCSPGDLIRDVASNGCWADLRHIEQVPVYRELVEALLQEVLAGAPRLERRCVSREGFVFITAPRAMTPVHSDPEHNFYLQIRGRKTIGLAPLASLDRAQLADWEVRRGYEGGYRRPLEAPPQVESFSVESGGGLYIPVYAIHEVRNTDEVSIALSVTCRTRSTEREFLKHALNRHLRRSWQRIRSLGTRAVRAGG